MTAARNVPYAIGELNAAYTCGLPAGKGRNALWAPQIGELNAAYTYGLPAGKGWNALWAPQNGLPLYHKIRKFMDAGRLLIVPDFDTTSHSRVVLLDESLSIYLQGPKFGLIHNWWLLFKPGSRPGKRNLYLVCLVTLFFPKISILGLWGKPG